MILETLFLVLIAVITAYMIRHYIFTITVLYTSKQHLKPKNICYQPKVSILIPAKNEETVIGRLLKRITELTYPKEKLEVIVIDDASTDKTGEIAEEFSEKHDFIKVIHRSPQEGGKGKPEALNEAMKHVKNDIILCFDADYYPQRDIIEKLVDYFADPKVGAVQSRVTVLNEPENLVTRLVALERIGGYRVDQKARNDLKLIPQYGGTAGGFRKELVEALGGWNPAMLAEDTDLTFRIYLMGYKICYINDVECYEEAVENWRAYWRQRQRWAKGHMQCAFKYTWPIIKSRRLGLKEKIDGLLVLHIYFLPILVFLAWILGVFLYISNSRAWPTIFLTFIPLSVYSAVGNFAPFFEVGVGAYLDGRTRIFWLIPLLALTFLYNMAICITACLTLCLSKILGKRHTWTKTFHNGRGNGYFLK
jgi:cellulose synthase/poly-beta-1,6-N-acetylglucosamine synthase-like glycosyltransferase